MQDDPLLRAAQLDYMVRHIGPQWVEINGGSFECHWPVAGHTGGYIATRPHNYQFYLVEPSTASVEPVEEEGAPKAELVPCGSRFPTARVIQMALEGYLGDQGPGLHYYSKYVTRVCLVGGLVDPQGFAKGLMSLLSLSAQHKALVTAASIKTYSDTDLPGSARLRAACTDGVVWLGMRVFMGFPQ